MKEIKVIGLDLAKQVFQVHGVNTAGETVLRRTSPRSNGYCRSGIREMSSVSVWLRMRCWTSPDPENPRITRLSNHSTAVFGMNA